MKHLLGGIRPIKPNYHTAIFVIPPAKLDDIIEVMGEAHVEFESVQSGLDVIYWSADLQNYSKSRWSKTASTSINNCVTLRTANTVYKAFRTLPKVEGLESCCKPFAIRIK
ncbi:hypothetical protein MX850_10140 [Erysipelothrix sp. Poltava]|nr:hypothetical protein MX850_10140 [Erysipelothrix sp. Poltava]